MAFDPRTIAEQVRQMYATDQSGGGSPSGRSGANTTAPAFALAPNTGNVFSAMQQGAKAASPAAQITSNPYGQFATNLAIGLTPGGKSITGVSSLLGALTGLMTYLGVNPATPGSNLSPSQIAQTLASMNIADTQSQVNLMGHLPGTLDAQIAQNVARGVDDPGPPTGPPGEGDGPGVGVGGPGGSAGGPAGGGDSGNSGDFDMGGDIGRRRSRMMRDGQHVAIKALPSEFVMNPHATRMFHPVLNAMNALALSHARRQMGMPTPQVGT